MHGKSEQRRQSWKYKMTIFIAGRLQLFAFSFIVLTGLQLSAHFINHRYHRFVSAHDIESRFCINTHTHTHTFSTQRTPKFMQNHFCSHTCQGDFHQAWEEDMCLSSSEEPAVSSRTVCSLLKTSPDYSPIACQDQALAALSSLFCNARCYALSIANAEMKCL